MWFKIFKNRCQAYWIIHCKNTCCPAASMGYLATDVLLRILRYCIDQVCNLFDFNNKNVVGLVHLVTAILIYPHAYSRFTNLAENFLYQWLPNAKHNMIFAFSDYIKLGVKPWEAKSEVRKKCRALSLLFHPDKNPQQLQGSHEKIIEINDACARLLNEKVSSNLNLHFV